MLENDNYNITNILKHKANFEDDILKKTLLDISKLNLNEEDLRKNLYHSLEGEGKILTRQRLYADSSSEKIFSRNGLLNQLNDRKNNLNDVITNIIKCYINEINNHFNPTFFNATKKVNYFFFSRLLNKLKMKFPNDFSTMQRLSMNQVSIVGNIELVKKLSKIGTLIVVPTHYSNLDSMLISMVLDFVGLQPVMYGAGLNLFNNITSVVLNRVGAYRIDRRKKNFIYLTTLQNYSSIAIHYGCDCLFYPGGTRMRNGAVETNLKRGLLRTTIAAQGLNYSKYGQSGKKIFIVPLILNYPFVLESSSLIRDYIKKNFGVSLKDRRSIFERISPFLKNISDLIFEKSKITVSFGDPMDVLGNKIDNNGGSIDDDDNIINLFDIFKKTDPDDPHLQRSGSMNLTQNIIKQYHKHNVVIPSSLLAFVAFEILISERKEMSMKDFFSLSNKEFKINAYTLANKLKIIREVILDYAENGLIDVSEEVRHYSIEDIIKEGISSLGIYSHRPLQLDKHNFYRTEDIASLFYYHNRLVGYELEKFI